MQLTNTLFRAFALVVSFLSLPFWLNAQAFSDTFEQDLEDGNNTSYAPTDEDELRLRVMNLDGPIQGYWGEDVKKLIQHRLKQREFTQELIGRTVMYGSVIEKALIENNLPVELQNLCVVESALNPRIISKAGAAGLWQLMPETAREMGLVVNNTIDERFDPYKSTQAATKYLKKMYEQFQDWGLALSAYNAGPAKINWALKQLGNSGTLIDFWSIRKYLKAETQNYIPAFLAANYVMQYYPWHNLKPQLPNLDLQITEVVLIKESISFNTISQITEIPVATIQLLNPAYTKDYVPENSNTGNYVMLPKRVIQTFLNYINLPKEARTNLTQKSVILTSSVNPNSFYEKIKITIGANDNVHNLAQAFNCSAMNIRSWNQLASYYVAQGQQVRIFIPKNTSTNATLAANAPLSSNEIKNEAALKAKPILEKRETVEAVLAINAVVKAEINPNEKPKESTIERLKKMTNPKDVGSSISYQYHFFGRNESLLDIAEKYGISSVKEILDLNNFNVTDTPVVGTKLRIRVL
jgi:membrane-bound lytic murein transglycosylase D